MIVLIFIAALLVVAVFVAILIRKVGKSTALVQQTRVIAARSDAKAQVAEETNGRLFNVADKALDRAEVIEEVNDKMDALLGFVAGDEQEPRGRHHAPNLKVVPGSPEEDRYIA